jgi:hypothetical protein
MKAQYVYEALDFQRGKDPKSAMDIGLSQTIYDKWERLQQESGIGSINIQKSLNSRWHLVIYVSKMPNSSSDGFKKAKDIFGPLIGDFYNYKGGEILIAIPKEFERAFIDAYKMRYPL